MNKKTNYIHRHIFIALLLSILTSTAMSQGNKENQPRILIDSTERELGTVSWSTIREVNTSYFILEMGSDEDHLVYITTKEAAGSSLSPRSYSCEDLDIEDTMVRITLVTMEGERYTTDYQISVDQSSEVIDSSNHITLK